MWNHSPVITDFCLLYKQDCCKEETCNKHDKHMKVGGTETQTDKWPNTSTDSQMDCQATEKWSASLQCRLITDLFQNES